MGTKVGMGTWVATLSAEQLLELLRARPDAAQAPEPRTLAELAGRLSTDQSIARALDRMSLPQLQVTEALLALGGSADRDELRHILGITDPRVGARLDGVLDELCALALVWPAGTTMRVAGGWHRLLPDPLALGRPGRVLYGQLTVAQLSRIGSAHGLGGLSGKRAWIDAVSAAAADPSTVEQRLERAGPELAEVVRRVAWRGPTVAGVHAPPEVGRVLGRATGMQLVVQGWVVPVEWGVGEMPREVALAVRGSGYHAPFDAEPPRPATAPIDAGRSGDAGRHAAGGAVEAVRRLLALLDRTPLALLRTGGVGVRELRRAAKLLSAPEAAVRLWLEIAAGAGLVAPSGEALLATTDADGWLDADPADALSRVLLAWWQLPVVPTHRVDDAGRPAPAVTGPFGAPEHARLRADALAELARLPAGRGLADLGELAGVLAHRRPAAYGRFDIDARLAATLAEATLLGLVSDGAPTPLGADLRAAVDTDDPAAALALAAAGVLPAPTRTATFLPDLTAIVMGGAAAELARLLDDAADAESRDTASTWRFGPASVRRALDGGRTADELLAALAAIAENPLPQPLEYLVRDVARRHGQLQVFAVASCIRVRDPALAVEVAAHRLLSGLRLRVLADTVLASAKPIGETITALRRAGYAPVQQNASGQTVVERVPVRRADPIRRGDPRRGPRYPPGGDPPDLAALAARLAGR